MFARRWTTSLLIAIVCATTASIAPSPGADAVPTAEGETPAAFLHEVRLRKLHLVRPDLIPYPVAYEVHC